MAFTTVISEEQLAQHLNDSEFIIFDCRHDLAQPNAGLAAYNQAHIPSARFLHLDDDLSGPRNGVNGRHPLPDPKLFCKKLGAAGMDNKKQAIAYDSSGNMFAARLWWLLRWLGHTNVAVLDGGLPAWQRAGLPLSSDIPKIKPAVFNGTPNPYMFVDAAIVEMNLRNPQFCLIDARSSERFHGINETLDPVGGHIPGAANHFFKNNLDADERFKSARELEKVFSKLVGKHRPDQVVHQCGSGVTACHNILAMEIAGLSGSKLYPGSWSEWSSDPKRPVEV